MTSEVRYNAFRDMRNKLKNTPANTFQSAQFKDVGEQMKKQINNLTSLVKKVNNKAILE